MGKALNATNVFTVVMLLAALIAPEVAMAAPQFASGGSTFKNDIVQILTPFFGIGIIACGVGWWFGKMSWMWMVGLCVGAILVFGHEQIITWVRGAFAV